MLFDKAKAARRLWLQHGTYFVLRRAVCRVLFPYWGYKLFGKKRSFQFDARSLSFLYHRYNTAWRTERTIEVPIVLDALERIHARSVLEIGNVLRHYVPNIDRLVVDKYEIAEGILNIDVVDYQPDRKFDAIVSISTIEHVGWDEEPREPKKSVEAINHLKSLLNPNGVLLLTLPVGHNSYLDDALVEARVEFHKVTYVERLTQSGRWEERSLDEIKHRTYNNPYPGAGAIAVCEFTQPRT
jgi:SAM-dependent methyltransferase